ncbi:MAG TPA: YdeI/OmpD-associated family protein [Gaiellaceae bacterium]|nr:YdeI/OmpD-associated family protein [Gaiellaceae bacterium]
MPKDLASALDDEARAALDRMSYTHRKEHVEWIKEAKREETRRRRIAKAVELIRAGKPRR